MRALWLEHGNGQAKICTYKMSRTLWNLTSRACTFYNKIENASYFKILTEV